TLGCCTIHYQLRHNLLGRWRRFMTIKVSVAPKGMGLNDFVAMQEGWFVEEGFEVELNLNFFAGTQGSWRGLRYFERPQDTPFSEGRSVIQGACAWGSICNASAGMGKFVPDCYGISPWGFLFGLTQRLRSRRTSRTSRSLWGCVQEV